MKIIGVEGDKLSLSIKQLTADPWEAIAERYPVGKRVSGNVVRFADYGAFLQLEKDISGLVHLTEIAHHKVADHAQALKIGQKVEAQVINIDVDERRIGLSIKAILPIDKETLERIKKEREEEEAKAKEEKAGKAGKAETATQPHPSAGADTKPQVSSPAGFVASKTGKKYYPAGSAAGDKIKEENRIDFKTEEDAVKAGYSA